MKKPIIRKVDKHSDKVTYRCPKCNYAKTFYGCFVYPHFDDCPFCHSKMIPDGVDTF